MKLNVYSMYDVKAQSFAAPMVFVNDEICRRGVLGVLGGDNEMSKFPGDFDVYRIGTFDTDDALIAPDQPALVFNIGELLAAAKGN